VSRHSDTVARLGGDEFGVILSRIDSREGAMKQSERLANKINAPFVFEERPLPLSASIGCAVYPDDGKHIDEKIDKADQSMYAIKRGRKQQR
jgi:diguanylate cyclase (GGDEF)-like protein